MFVNFNKFQCRINILSKTNFCGDEHNYPVKNTLLHTVHPGKMAAEVLYNRSKGNGLIKFLTPN
jgi:hypothetical protein